MMMRSEADSLTTLVRETAREATVAYIAIVDEQGRVVAAAGQWPKAEKIPVTDVLAMTEPFSRLTRKPEAEAVFEVAKEFVPVPSGGLAGMGMTGGRGPWCAMDGSLKAPACRQVIFVGLYTREFDAARRADVKHSLLMGGLLLLLGSSGFYFLFLSQGARVARTTLANMELYTRNIIQSMPAGLLTMDTEGRVVSGNRKALELFQVDDVEIQGKTLRDLALTGHCTLELPAGEEHEFLERPMECRRPDGASLPVKVSASRLTGRNGEFLGTVLILRDMREIRDMEEQLERSRRLAALGRMAAGIAHEIRNPLGTLRGFAQYFGNQSQGDPNSLEYANLMVSEVDRLNRTISALLQFARPREPEFRAIMPDELLQRTARLMEDDFTSHGLIFKLELSGDTIPLEADPDLLTQMFINLLQNAMAATEPGGEVCLAGQAENAAVHFWVRDTGKGMTAEEKNSMFDPFFTTRKTGTGLGLAVVHQIVEQHRGHIEVESVLGRGTRIEVILPRKRNHGKT